jgi:hypothetical protein
MKCRHCRFQLHQKVLDLGFAPPSNSFLSEEDINKPEMFFPLRVYVCQECWLIQTADFLDEKTVFPDSYVYFSSTSTSWMQHAKRYTQMIVKRLSLDGQSKVIEIASNDGYLLRNFNELGIPNLGIEPTNSTANAAEDIGVTTVRSFFSYEFAKELCEQGHKASLIIGNNVYGHVPDINDFTAGLAELLLPNGVVTLEFPHCANLLTKNQFDTVYHEHFSYLSLCAVQKIFTKYGLRVFDVEQIETHGGSLRVYGCLIDAEWATTESVEAVVRDESTIGLMTPEGFVHLQKNAEVARNELLRFLLDQSKSGRRVVGYGAAAKGNTLLNFAGVKPDLIECVADGAEAKQGKFLPGSHIPVVAPSSLSLSPGDSVILFPWNIANEVGKLLRDRFGNRIDLWTPIPYLRPFN